MKIFLLSMFGNDENKEIRLILADCFGQSVGKDLENPSLKKFLYLPKHMPCALGYLQLSQWKP